MGDLNLNDEQNQRIGAVGTALTEPGPLRRLASWVWDQVKDLASRPMPELGTGRGGPGDTTGNMTDWNDISQDDRLGIIQGGDIPGPGNDGYPLYGEGSMDIGQNAPAGPAPGGGRVDIAGEPAEAAPLPGAGAQIPLVEDLPTRAVRNDFNPAEEALQLALQRAGADPGPIDGMAGPQTLNALNEYLRQIGVSAPEFKPGDVIPGYIMGLIQQ